MKRSTKRRAFGRERHIPGILVRKTTSYTQDSETGGDLADAPGMPTVLDDIEQFEAMAREILAGHPDGEKFDELTNEYRARDVLRFARSARHNIESGDAENAVWCAIRMVERASHIRAAILEEWTATGREFFRRDPDNPGGRPAAYTQETRDTWQQHANKYWTRHPNATKADAARYVSRQDGVSAGWDYIRKHIEKPGQNG